MSKLKRSALKSVVKECLLEILSEGINTNVQRGSHVQQMGNSHAQDQLNELNNANTSESVKLNEKISSITTDPILASVLGDTAQTTLVEQSAADRTGHLRQMKAKNGSTHSADYSEQVDGNSHWAALAFADKK